MAEPLAASDDVETALLRPLTATEAQFIDGLLDQASALLRQAAPSIDDRIARYGATPADPSAVAPGVVAAVLAGAVKRYLVNLTGAVSKSDTMGPFGHTESYALRTDKNRRGALEITDEDLAVLFPIRKRLRAGTIRTRPALAPRPVGRYGPLSSVGEAVDAVQTFGGNVVPDAWVGPQ